MNFQSEDNLLAPLILAILVAGLALITLELLT